MLEHFPTKSQPRQQQKEILEQLSKAIKANKKFIVIQAATGSGKSFISATLANYSNLPDQYIVEQADKHKLFAKSPQGGYQVAQKIDSLPYFGTAVLTVTKALQNQYDQLFDDSQVLKGKQNYICKVDEDFDCDIAPCTPQPSIMEQCKAIDRCPMLNARRDTLKSKFAVFNYSIFLGLPEHLQKRQILVCDEASELEDELVKHYSCTINYKRDKFKELNVGRLITEDRNVAFRWINDVIGELKQQQDDIISQFRLLKKDKRRLMSAINKLRTFKRTYEKLILVLQNWYNSEYIVELNKDEVTFTPLYVNIIAQNFFKHSNHVILMSGTIIDHEQFVNTLGIKEYEYIEADSDFNPKYSPIYCSTQFKLNHKNLDTHLPTLTKLVKKICEEYKDEKGIVHTHSFKITDAMAKAVKGDKRFLVRSPGVTNEYLLDSHRLSNSKTVLISPSLGFGTDLADEFGRFSIIMKTPYLPLGNKRIKTLFEKNKRWYMMKALVNLVQMCGRTTRSKDDYSDTYILDATAVDLIKRNSNRLPIWFRRRIQ